MLKIKKIKPMLSGIVTTGEKFEEDMYEKGIIIAYKGDLKTYQKVIAVGSMVRDINVGDQVMINTLNYAVRKYDPNSIKNDFDMNKIIEYRFNWVKIEDKDGKLKECLLLSDRDILFVFEGEEVQGSKTPIITENNNIILS